MSSSQATLKFITLVELHFPAPKFGGDQTREDLWTQSINDVLAPYDDEIVLEAAARIVRTRDPHAPGGSMFPKPFDVVKVCDEVREIQRIRAAPLLETRTAMTKREKHEADLRSWSEDRIELAMDLCRGELGRRAATEGWINALFDYCRGNARLPKSSDEISGLMRSSKRYRDLVEDLKNREQCTVTQALIKLGENVFAKADERSKQVLGRAS